VLLVAGCPAATFCTVWGISSFHLRGDGRQQAYSTPPTSASLGRRDVKYRKAPSTSLYFMQYFRPDPASGRQLTLQRSGFAWAQYALHAEPIAQSHQHPVSATYVAIDDVEGLLACRPARQSVHSPAAIVHMPTEDITNIPVDPIVRAKRVMRDLFSKGKKWGRPGEGGRPRTRALGGGMRANGGAVSFDPVDTDRTKQSFICAQIFRLCRIAHERPVKRRFRSRRSFHPPDERPAELPCTFCPW
jgi:hypothetical protein